MAADDPLHQADVHPQLGRTIHNSPRAPTSPSMALMTSTDECSFLRAVAESPTAQEAVARWSPTNTTPKKTKRLAHQPKHGGSRGKKRGGGGHRGGGSRGGRSRGKYSGRGGGSHQGGSIGGHQGYSQGPTIVQSGIHYHAW